MCRFVLDAVPARYQGRTQYCSVGLCSTILVVFFGTLLYWVFKNCYALFLSAKFARVRSTRWVDIPCSHSAAQRLVPQMCSAAAFLLLFVSLLLSVELALCMWFSYLICLEYTVERRGRRNVQRHYSWAEQLCKSIVLASILLWDRREIVLRPAWASSTGAALIVRVPS
jgi:hypothetical protein